MKKYKDIIFGIGIMILFFGGMFALVSYSGNSSSSNATLSPTAPLKEWSTGNLNSKVVLVEYSDYQCPACAAYNPIVNQLLKEFGNQIKFSYRNFPLSQHQNAIPAASAAEAAGNQGKFWEMHDLLFENQNDWADLADATSVFESYATKLGLNIEQFRSDVKSKEVADKIQKDYDIGVESQIDSTPTFFLNGKKITDPQTYDQFKTIITEALAANS